MDIDYEKLSRLGLSNAQFFDREIRVLKNAYWFDEVAGSSPAPQPNSMSASDSSLHDQKSFLLSNFF